MALAGMPSELKIWTIAPSISLLFPSTTTPVTMFGILGEVGNVMFFGTEVGGANWVVGADGAVKITLFVGFCDWLSLVGTVTVAFSILVVLVSGMCRSISLTSSSGLSLRTSMVGLVTGKFCSCAVLLFCGGGLGGSALKIESREVIFVVSRSLRSDTC